MSVPYSVCCLKPGTHWRQSWIQHGRLYWKSTVLLWLLTHWRRQSRNYCIGNRVERIRQQSTLLPILATVDFQQSRRCWIQLCRQCVPGFIRKKTAVNLWLLWAWFVFKSQRHERCNVGCVVYAVIHIMPWPCYRSTWQHCTMSNCDTC